MLTGLKGLCGRCLPSVSQDMFPREDPADEFSVAPVYLSTPGQGSKVSLPVGLLPV